MNKKEYRILTKLINENSFDYVAFDLFDTLLVSKYSRQYAFIKYADFLVNEYHVDDSIKRLYQSISVLFRDKIKTTFYDIYLHYRINDYTDYVTFKEQSYNLFLDSEKENLTVAPYIVDLMLLLKQKNIPLLLISDYYFGSDFITKLLDWFNLNDFYKLFVSYDYGHSKSSGKLYELLPTSKKILMIGDSYHSDCTMAQKFGLSAFHIDSSHYYKQYTSYNNSYSKDLTKIIWKYHIRDKKYYSCNYSYIIFDFCKRLYCELKYNDNVSFLSREGQFLKKCFDLYLKSIGNKKNIQTNYLLISRLAISNVSNDIAYNYEDLCKRFKNISEWIVNDLSLFLTLLGLEKEEIETLKLKNNICSNTLTKDNIQPILDDPLYKELTEKKKIAAQNFFYNSLLYNNQRLIIVDFGGKGTMQDCIAEIIDKKLDLYGYYFGITPANGEKPKSYKKGLIFEYCDPLFTGNNYCNTSTFEALLRADHGMVACYKSRDCLMIDDASVFVYKNYSKERQQKMFDLFVDLCEINKKSPIEKSCLETLRPLIMDKPEICLFYDYYFSCLQEKLDIDNTVIPAFNYFDYYIKKLIPRSLILFLKKGIKKILKI